jgi:RHS repeat-associated protein
MALVHLFGQLLRQVFLQAGSNVGEAIYLTDRLGSVRNLTDSNGNLIDTITYDGFGNVTNETSTLVADRWKYTGREFDRETGLQFNRARYLDQKTGRWTSQDPLGFEAGDSNLYRYVSNAPSWYRDASGQDAIFSLARFRAEAHARGPTILSVPHNPKPRRPTLDAGEEILLTDPLDIYRCFFLSRFHSPYGK